jgi:hypothetical protein
MEAYLVLGIVAAALYWVHREARIAFGPGRGISFDWSIPTSSGIDDSSRRYDDYKSVEHNSRFDAVESNPATGLPMIGGIGGVDSAGNAFGSSSISDYTDFSGSSISSASSDPFSF